MHGTGSTAFRWLRTGEEVFAAILGAIKEARHSVRLEMYIFHSSPLADELRATLAHAAGHGVKVQVMIDAWGSQEMSESYWDPLKQAGGQFRWFNPFRFRHVTFRNHRKLLVCDDQVAFIGGFNVAPEYAGDGVARGWRDMGLQIFGAPVVELAASFDELFGKADFRGTHFMRLRKTGARKTRAGAEWEIFFSGPGREFSPAKRALYTDLKNARRVQILAAYFLPTWRIRRDLQRIARRGGQVQLILPGKSDVPLAQIAGRSFYSQLLNAGVEVYEYQPQILHSKLLIVDDIAYAGSANLDIRSLHINYELIMRLSNPELAAAARQLFEQDLANCARIDPAAWRKSRTIWTRWKEDWARFVLGRLDPYVARKQLGALR
jgi:cardiolipin synthase A/B